MPELTAILLAEQFRADILKAEAASSVRLVNAYGVIYKRLLLQMDALAADLDKIAAKGEAPTRWQLQRLDRFRAIKAQVLDEMQRYAAGVEIEIDQGARNAIAAAGKNGRDLVEASLPGVAEIDARIMASWQSLNPDAVETMVGFLDSRSPLKQGLRTMYGPTVADAVERGLLESIALGYNPRKLAATFTRDLGMGLVSSLRLSRTVQLNAYREATRAGYAANPEIVKGWKRRATRDSRTCMACLSLDGSIHPVTESLQDHWNGRCVALPMAIDYSDLGLDVPPRQPTDQWLASLPQDQQRAYLGPKRYDAWKSGDLRFSETGRQWFERQPEAAQRAQMGPRKWEAWKAGKFQFDELSIRVPDRVWGVLRVETPLKTLLKEDAAAV